jgi:TatD DNase family protein
MMCCATEERDWERTVQVSSLHEGVRYALGVHPWFAAGCSDGWVERLESLVRAGGCGAGEIGLDHAIENVDHELQERVFVEQLRLARRLGVAVSVHCRKAWGRMMELLRSEAGGLPPGVMHSYSGPPEFVAELERLGFYLSFSGSITRDFNRRGPRALAAVSNERLLIETDSPAIVPAGAPGEVNVPANLLLTLRAVARIRGLPPEELAELTWQNAVRLFGGVSPEQGA